MKLNECGKEIEDGPKEIKDNSKEIENGPMETRPNVLPLTPFGNAGAAREVSLCGGF
jgi:hypothetical protein